ncbi:MAG TPA: RNA polymerase sigma factor [Pyrinomonadaceae bacterium]|nr:RNA polymerase sigma factor [Pyrinomonadaceae bacterium]
MSMVAETLSVWPESVGAPVPTDDETQCSDQELTQRAAAGDASAFAEVYRRYHRRVYSLCLRMTQNVAEAEDITQEIFVQLMRKIGSFRGDAAFTTWLYRLTTNYVLMHFRKAQTRRELTTADGQLPTPAIRGREAAGYVPLLDRVALNTAIAQLPPGYRLIFIMHDVLGHEHEEIARLLGCGVGTSKSQLHKARMRLRGLIKGTPPKQRPQARP